MYNLDFIPLVRTDQEANTNAFDKIYEVFERSIRFYAARLHDDDALQELNVFLIELLYQLPLNKFYMNETCDLQKYIAACIRNKYLQLSKSKSAQEWIGLDCCDYFLSCEPINDNHLTLSSALQLLTEKQRLIIIYKYYYGYSDVEISNFLHISRQAVNRTKTRGLLVLRTYMEK